MWRDPPTKHGCPMSRFWDMGYHATLWRSLLSAHLRTCCPILRLLYGEGWDSTNPIIRSVIPSGARLGPGGCNAITGQAESKDLLLFFVTLTLPSTTKFQSGVECSHDVPGRSRFSRARPARLCATWRLARRFLRQPRILRERRLLLASRVLATRLLAPCHFAIAQLYAPRAAPRYGPSYGSQSRPIRQAPDIAPSVLKNYSTRRSLPTTELATSEPTVRIATTEPPTPESDSRRSTLPTTSSAASMSPAPPIALTIGTDSTRVGANSHTGTSTPIRIGPATRICSIPPSYNLGLYDWSDSDNSDFKVATSSDSLSTR